MASRTGSSSADETDAAAALVTAMGQYCLCAGSSGASAVLSAGPLGPGGAAGRREERELSAMLLAAVARFAAEGLDRAGLLRPAVEAAVKATRDGELVSVRLREGISSGHILLGSDQHQGSISRYRTRGGVLVDLVALCRYLHVGHLLSSNRFTVHWLHAKQRGGPLAPLVPRVDKGNVATTRNGHETGSYGLRSFCCAQPHPGVFMRGATAHRGAAGERVGWGGGSLMPVSLALGNTDLWQHAVQLHQLHTSGMLSCSSCCPSGDCLVLV